MLLSSMEYSYKNALVRMAESISVVFSIIVVFIGLIFTDIKAMYLVIIVTFAYSLCVTLWLNESVCLRCCL